MRKKIEQIKARIKRKKELLSQGLTDGESKRILTEEGFYSVQVEPKEEIKANNQETLNGKPVQEESIESLREEIRLRKEAIAREEIFNGNAVQVEPIEDFKADSNEHKAIMNDKPIQMAWCHICKQKVEVIAAEVIQIDTKKGHRHFLTGRCYNCNRKVSSIVKG